MTQAVQASSSHTVLSRSRVVLQSHAGSHLPLDSIGEVAQGPHIQQLLIDHVLVFLGSL